MMATGRHTIAKPAPSRMPLIRLMVPRYKKLFFSTTRPNISKVHGGPRLSRPFRATAQSGSEPEWKNNAVAIVMRIEMPSSHKPTRGSRALPLRKTTSITNGHSK